MRMTRRATGLFGVGLTSVVMTCAVTACGSSSSVSSGGVAADSPVIIYTSTPIGSAVGNAPEIGAGAKAAARELNAKGGLDGHQLEIKVCNDTDANEEVLCARDATSDNALAFTGSIFIFNPGSAEAALQAASIANVAPLVSTNAQYAVPINFPVDVTANATADCPALVAEMPGHSAASMRVAPAAIGLPIGQDANSAAATVARHIGATVLGGLLIPTTTTSYAPLVQKLANEKPTLVPIAEGAAGLSGMLEASVSSGADLNYCTNAANVNSPTFRQLGQSADGYLVATGLPPVADAAKIPELGQFVSDMQAEQKAGDAAAVLSQGSESDALRSWLGVQIIVQVAKSIHGPLTGKSLLDALNSDKNVTTGGILPTLNFTAPPNVPGWQRAFNPVVLLTKWDVSKSALIDTGVSPRDLLVDLGLKSPA